MKIAFIVVAGGTGSRMGFAENKLFKALTTDSKFNDEIVYDEKSDCNSIKSILEITLKQIKKIDRIEQLIVSHRYDETDKIKHIVYDKVFNLSKKNLDINLVIGGQTRHMSIHNAFKVLNDDITHVMVHDAVRPFVDLNLLNKLIDELAKGDTVIPTIAISDTIREIEDGYAYRTLDRSKIHLIQTPQCYPRSIADDIYNFVEKIIFEDKLEILSDVTDDVSLIKKVHPNLKIKCIEGSKNNIKITTREDLYLARLMYIYLKEQNICE